MYLLCCLWFFVAYYDMHILIEHIPGASNEAADHLSRFDMHSFFLTNPQADLLPTPLPQELIQLASIDGPDWTSPNFRRLLSGIIHRV